MKFANDRSIVLTPSLFGKAVRKARVDLKMPLGSMAVALEVSASYLNSLETGKRFVSSLWVERIEAFFRSHGHPLDLAALAEVSNERVSLKGLSLEHKHLVARLARTPLTEAQLAPFEKLLRKIKTL